MYCKGGCVCVNWAEEKQRCKIPIIVMYERPGDYPNRYVARLWDIDRPTTLFETAETLEELELLLPLEGMVWIERHANDDPVILGTWV